MSKVKVEKDRSDQDFFLDAFQMAMKMSDREIAFAGQQEGQDIRFGNATLDQLSFQNFPKNKLGKIYRALKWLEEDDLLERLVSVKTDFTTTGFSMVVKPEEGDIFSDFLSSVNSSGDTEDTEETGTDEGGDDKKDKLAGLSETQIQRIIELSEFQKTLNKIQRKWDFYAIVKQLVQDWHATDSMILYWKVDPESGGTPLDEGDLNLNQSSDSEPAIEGSKESLIPGLIDISALSPGEVDWDNSLGQDILKVAIPSAVKSRIETALQQRDQELRQRMLAELLKEGIPRKYIVAVNEGEEFVTLDREDGDNWLIRTRNRKHYGLANPSMGTVFIDLEIRKAFKEGDFAAAYMMKHFILHVTAGESIDSGPLAGQKNNWIKAKESKSLFEHLQLATKASRMVTNHTVKFNFVFPPKEMFDDTKYNKHEESIYNWSGVSVVVHTGEGGNYGSGFISIKRLIAHLLDARREIVWLITEFFDHPTIKDKVGGVPENSEISATFDENALKEPRQLLDELKFMVENGFGDPRMSLKELGRDPDTVRRSKMESRLDNANTKSWEPIYEKNKGRERDRREKQDSAGRPPNDGTTQSEETRTQEPSRDV